VLISTRYSTYATILPAATSYPTSTPSVPTTQITAFKAGIAAVSSIAFLATFVFFRNRRRQQHDDDRYRDAVEAPCNSPRSMRSPAMSPAGKVRTVRTVRTVQIYLKELETMGYHQELEAIENRGFERRVSELVGRKG
jgi:hypothetical protein